VCSSVLEEGIDVQACNHVIILDPIKTFNMYVQTKGRARSRDASFVLFASDLESSKITEQIKQYRQAHEEIRDYLESRVLERAEPQLNEINEHSGRYTTIYQFKWSRTFGQQCSDNTASLLPTDAFGCFWRCPTLV